MFYRFFCTFIISLLLSLPAYSSEDLSQTPTEDKTLFMGIIIKNYDKLVEPFLKSIEKLDYDKKQIAIQIDFYGNSPTVKKQVKKWTEKNKEKYRNISYPHEESNETLNCSLVNYHPLKKYKFFG